MRASRGMWFRIASATAVLALLGLPITLWGNVRTQLIDLGSGWNAVHLEVNPIDSDRGVIFADLPVDVVAVYFAPTSPAQFMDDPSIDMLRDAGWNVWYAPRRPDSFLATLFAINGPVALLVHAEEEVSWKIEGVVLHQEFRWRPNAYNFVGFGVDKVAAPTFEQFFSGSAALGHDQIYRLVEGEWRQIVDPDAVTMRSGEAFWIYCDGASRYQGPLRIEASSGSGMVFKESVATLVLKNEVDHPITPTIEHVHTKAEPIPLSIVIDLVGDPSDPIRRVAAPQPTDAWRLPLPPLSAGRAIGVPLEARLEEMNSVLHSSLLKITTDMGTETYVQMIALRDDLISNQN